MARNDFGPSATTGETGVDHQMHVSSQHVHPRTWSIHLVFPRIVRPSSKLVFVDHSDSPLDDGTGFLELAFLLLVRGRFRPRKDGVRFGTAHVPGRRVSADDEKIDDVLTLRRGRP